MTIPEQAVEAAALVLVQRDVGGQVKNLDELQSHDRGEVTGTARKMLEAAQPLLGVQRPEDVARALAQSMHGMDLVELSKDEKTVLYEAADAVLALPHTGQPQEGDREAGEREMAAWAERDQYMRSNVRLVAAVTKLRAALDGLRPFPLVVEPVAAALIAEADAALSAAPASPRAEGEPDYGEDVLGERPQ